MNSKSNYPNGFENGLTIRNKPIDMTISGNVFFVGKTPEGQAGSNGYSGTYNWPFATIDFAIGKCTANHGDIIFVKAGHTETITTAGGIAAEVAGISIIGLGSGGDRPTITFGSTDNSASMTITAASVTVENIIGTTTDDGLSNPFNVTGNDCWLDIEWRDASSTVEAARAVQATTVSNLYVKLKYVGFTAGNACVNAVNLVAVTGARIIIDAYGEFSTGVVEMVTTASTDVLVGGYFYNDNVALTKNVVNTGGLACTWFAYGWDGKGSYAFSGGSTAGLAVEDLSILVATVGALTDVAATGVVTDTDTIMAYVKQLVTELQVMDGLLDVPTADAVTDTTIRDVVGRKTDAAVVAVGVDKSLMAYSKGLLTHSIQRKKVASVVLAAANFTGTTTRFTVSGGPIRVLSLGIYLTTALPAGANTLKFSFTPTNGGATDLSGAVDTASAVVNSFLMCDGVKATATVISTDGGILAGGQPLHMPQQGILLGTGVLQTIFSVGPPATGAGTMFLEYEPLTAASAVV